MDRQTTGLLIAAPLILLILGYRVWRSSRATKLSVERMWVGPVIIVGILILSIYSAPPPITVTSCAILGVAALLGVAVGWYRGRLVRISIDVATHKLTSQQSPWGMLIFIAIIAVRTGLRLLLSEQHDVAGIPVTVIVDAVTLLYAGNVVGLTLEKWLRAQKLLADATAAKAAGKTVPGEVTQAHAGDTPQAGHGG